MLADCPESRGVGLPEMCGGNQQVLTWAHASLRPRLGPASAVLSVVLTLPSLP